MPNNTRKIKKKKYNKKKTKKQKGSAPITGANITTQGSKKQIT